ncbi:MAG: anti-sigma factor [Actinomycetota bacterium]
MSERNDLDPTASDDELLRAIGLLDADAPPVVEPPADLWASIAAAAADDEAAATPSTSGGGAAVIDLSTRRRRLPMLGAVAAAVVVVAVGFAVVLGSGSSDDEPVAAVDLEPLVSDASAGAAELIADGDGYTLRVDAVAEPSEGEFLELWLIDEGVTEPRSLGRYTGAGDYEVPADLDPEAFPIVDISTEPDDGDASHSGASVLRGVLEL